MKRSLAAPVAVLAALLLAALPAAAITYGWPDEGRHPNVGALVGTFPDGTYPYCSGVLIAPKVFLTAAHCDIGRRTVYVTFDETYTKGATLYEGAFRADPQYNQSQNDPHDIAVVKFANPIDGITPAKLPTLGQFDDLKRGNGKNKAAFTAVGYGSLQVSNAPGGHVLDYRDTRMYSVGTLNAVTPAWLRISQNPARGNGGACYGDSGGPNFVGAAGKNETNIVAAITITGDTWCKATNVVYRLDTASARDFLSGYVNLRSAGGKKR